MSNPEWNTRSILMGSSNNKLCVRRCMRVREGDKLICCVCRVHTEKTGNKEKCMGADCKCIEVKQ